MIAVPDNILWLVIFILFALAAITQLVYYFLFYLRIKPGTPTETRSDKPVSVVICARNEAENLKAYLPSVLEQDYPEFEVIVVNDCSEDDTELVLTEFEQRYSNLRVTTIHKDSSLTHSKKMALFIGIKAAKNEILLLTDADCQSISSNWIGSMVSGFSDKPGFVLGYGGYLREKGLINKYIRYDTMFIAMQYMGMAIAGFPYMGVGRNLAYSRSLFFENKGFGPHLNLQSGDDDLFVNTLATKTNTSVVYSPDSFTRSNPAPTFAALTKQKSRHLSTAGYYRKATMILLMLEPLSRVLFYLLFTLLMLLTTTWQLPLIIFGVTLLIKMIVLRRVQNSLKEQDLLLFSLLFDIISPFINGYFFIQTRRNRYRSYEWK